MTLRISKVFTYDEDAGNYIQAVEAADGQVLEGPTRKAINNFVIGCKQDGIWSAIKASCILAGARTLSGALVPLVGAAPTNNNFVSGDYNRKTGLKGNASKYLNSNRNNNADPQDNNHNALFISSLSTLLCVTMGRGFAAGGNEILEIISPDQFNTRHRSQTLFAPSGSRSTGFIGTSRSSSSQYSARANATMNTFTNTSGVPDSLPVFIFARCAANGNPEFASDARLAFYSIGESLNLTLLDARVTALINALSAAIP